MYGPFVMSLEESDQFLNVLFLLEMLKYKQHQPSETNRTDKIKTSQGYRVFGFNIGGNGIGSFPQRVFFLNNSVDLNKNAFLFLS